KPAVQAGPAEPAEPEQGRMLSIGGEEAPGKMVFAGPPIKLDSVEDVRRVVSDPKTQITDEHRKFFQWLLDKGLLEAYHGLRMEVADSIAGDRAVGEYKWNERGGMARFLRWTEAK